jgi:ComF family protein
MLIPMPLHWLKLLRRGFNQSQLIAATVQSKLPNTSVRTDLCSRLHYGRAQHLQSKLQRQRSMSNTFVCRPSVDLVGARVALVDDVVTTGATATAATRSLLEAGVKSVDLWCIARTGWHNSASSIKIPL